MLITLIDTAKKLAAEGVPCDCLADDESSRSNHWTGTKDAMESFLGRDLSPEEVTVLSLSRHYGPTPCLGNAAPVLRRLWPEGNPHGLRYEWSDLIEEFDRLEMEAAGKDSEASSLYERAAALAAKNPDLFRFVLQARFRVTHGDRVVREKRL